MFVTPDQVRGDEEWAARSGERGPLFRFGQWREDRVAPGVGHRLCRWRIPFWAVVLVDAQRAAAFEEVVPLDAAAADRIFLAPFISEERRVGIDGLGRGET